MKSLTGFLGRAGLTALAWSVSLMLVAASASVTPVASAAPGDAVAASPAERQAWVRLQLDFMLQHVDGAELPRSIRKLAHQVQKRIADESRALRASLLESQAKFVLPQYDVVVIGAGPHGAILDAQLGGYGSGLKVLNVDSSPTLGGAFAGKQDTFFINSPELPGKSANPLPGAPAQLAQLTDARFAKAGSLSDAIVLTHGTSRAEYLLGSAVEDLTSFVNPDSSVSTIVKLSDGVRIKAKYVVIATGLGEPKLQGASEGTQQLLREARNVVRAGEIFPDIQYSDELLDRMQRQADLGRNALESWRGKRVAVVGAGDAGNIWVEGLLGKGPEALYGGEAGKALEIEVKWLGQKAATREEFLAANKTRYHANFETLFDHPSLTKMSGRLEAITRVMNADARGQTAYRLTYRNGPRSRMSLVADKVVLCTGYRNRAAELVGKLEGARLIPAMGQAGELGMTMLGAQAVDAAGKSLGVFVAGAAAAPLATPEELALTITKNEVSINALSLRTQGLAQAIGSEASQRLAVEAGAGNVIQGPYVKQHALFLSGDTWLKRWAAAGASVESAEVRALAELMNHYSERGQFVSKLSMKELVWDGKRWSLSETARMRIEQVPLRMRVPSSWWVEGWAVAGAEPGMADLARHVLKYLK